MIDLNEDSEIMSEINMTPLVDVMLVLLIIFIVTIPVINHASNIVLPQANNQVSTPKPDTIKLSIDSDGKMYWNDAIIEDTDLKARIVSAAQRQPQPELHLRADRKTAYERIAKVIASAQSAGLNKIGFITDPEK